MVKASAAGPPIFHFVMIKPTHYDDDGYPIQWLRSAIPSNTLACLNALAEDARKREVLGSGVDIRLHTYDETNRRVRPDKIIRMIEEAGGRALIGLVGVQSNQFPRAVDLARPFLEAGLPVCVGGFHVSGCLAMLPELPEDIRAAQELGISLFAGEAEEGRLDVVLRDAFEGQLAPLYNHMNDLPSLIGEPPPILPRKHVARTSGSLSSIDLGRGCPYQCSFCTIINVQGRKSRIRSVDDLERIVRENYADGIKRFFITDDNFARNKDWEPLFDKLIEMRQGEGMNIGFTIQVDTLCHKIPNFIEKASQAGVRRVFIGLENINPDNLIAAKKRQNKITDYREMLQKWRNHGAITYAGYIIGFPSDTKETIARDIEIIKRELPVDILEFFFLTPLPGSEDHKKLWEKGVWMDPDMNKYDLNHRVAHHSGGMSDTEWEEAYKLAWNTFYTPEHIETIIKRVCANKLGRPGTTLTTILWFYLMILYEGVHPLEGGALRRKFRRDRRSSMRRENPLVFYPRYFGETVSKAVGYFRVYRRTKKMLDAALKAPDRWTYTDLAIAPPEADEFEALDLYHATTGGEEALARKRSGDEIRARVAGKAGAVERVAAAE
ncbi:radical SAM protein [Microbaculum marinum]|uniref:Radical SAM protein n=1 Tax=Microbaculum marinum TaxID=1764581 RepID=A0AAW9RNY5_9HYPH